jgi:enoyl-CoA hydratase/carnithine racemase
MSAERVLAELDSGVLTLTLNRPEKRNALDSLMIDALHVSWQECGRKRGQRAAVG